METFDTLYLVVFMATALTIVLLERVGGLQRHAMLVRGRVVSNVSLFLLGNVFLALLIPVGLFAFAQSRPPGLVSGSHLPAAVQWLVTFVVLDLWRYWEHRLYHQFSLLWRLHRVHHSDTEIDVTTAERHHPIDLLVGTLVLMALTSALGLPAAGLAIYLLTATVVSLWSHANLTLPEPLDRVLRRVVVTPSLHAVHHSSLQAQTDTNYGSVLTVWDRLFGTYSDPATTWVQRFGLEYFAGPRDTRLWRVLQQPFLDHRAVTHAVARPAAQRIALSPVWRRTLGAGALGLCAVLAVMWPAAHSLTAAWNASEAFQWGWLVPPLVVYLLGWQHRAELLANAPQPDLRGVSLGAAAAALWWVADLMHVNVGREIALVLALHAVAWSTMGWALYRRVFPTLALLLLMVPSADLLQPLLRTITLESIKLFASALQLPHSTEGFIVMVGARRYIVVDECSGLAFVALAMFLGYAFGLFLYRSLHKVVGLALLGAALGVLCNVVRVNAIVWLDWVNGSQMDLTAHGHIQWLALLAVLGALVYVLTLLRGDAEPASAASATVRDAASEPSTGHWLAPVAAGLSVLAIVSGMNAVLARAAGAALLDRPAAAAQGHDLPPRIAGWTRAPGAAEWSLAPDGSTATRMLIYRRGEQQMHVHLVQTRTPEAKLPMPHPADVLPGHWRDVRTQRHAECEAGHCGAFMQTTLKLEGQTQRQDVYTAYSIGELVTDSTLSLRTAHAWARVTGTGWRQSALALSFDGETPTAVEVFRMMRALQAGLADAAAQH